MPTASPSEYAQLLRISSKALASVNPKLDVVLAGLGPGLSQKWPAAKFLTALYRQGAKPDFDTAALQPYDLTVPSVIDQIKAVRNVMRRNGDARTHLWLSELGWASQKLPGHRWAVGTEKKQATLLRELFQFMDHHARGLGITALFWFDWKDIPNYKDGQGLNFGLRDKHGKAKLASKAYRHFSLR